MLTSLIAVLRGAGAEMETRVEAANAVRIVEGELREASAAIARAKSDLATLMARAAEENRRRAAQDQRITELERKATAAMDLGQEGLALTAAARIAELEGERDQSNRSRADLDQRIEALRRKVGEGERTLASLTRKAAAFRAERSAARMDHAMHNASLGGPAGSAPLASAAMTLDRLEARLQFELDRDEAMRTLTVEPDGDLDRKMAAVAGDPTQGAAQAVLERLRARKQAPPSAS